MKSFLESAEQLDIYEGPMPRIYNSVITDDIQWLKCKEYLYQSLSDSGGDLTQDQGVYFLLFMAAINGEL